MILKVADVETMRNIDSYCINELKIPGIVLMENAALKVVKNIDTKKYSSFCIICTKGNNGGDGFAVARHLYNLGKCINVFLIGNEKNMSNDCRINYDILKNLGVKVDIIDNSQQIEKVKSAIYFSDMTIDAIFGTGLSRDVEGIYGDIISLINENSKYVLSIDIPSGLSGDTGKVLKNSIKANKTVSFQLYKKGFLNYEADEFTGSIIIEDIGIPSIAINKFNIRDFIITDTIAKNTLKIRNKYSHKGDFGRVVIIAGSVGFSGAAYISTQSAVKGGAGLVTLACRRELQNIMSSKLEEAMTVDLANDQKLEELIQKCDAVAVGPGMGNNEFTLNILKMLLNKVRSTLVIDADGINVLKGRLDILKDRKCKIIMTPHLGEMSGITGLAMHYIKENRIDIARKFARENDITLVLKGYNTVITDGYSLAINSTGNSAMASGGMGDCLTGMITSLAAQNYTPFEAACMAAYVHGLCGDRLSENMFCVNASDIISQIPFILKDILYK
jgi:NAD(P)H-hydrate epimerase